MEIKEKIEEIFIHLIRVEFPDDEIAKQEILQSFADLVREQRPKIINTISDCDPYDSGKDAVIDNLLSSLGMEEKV